MRSAVSLPVTWGTWHRPSDRPASERRARWMRHTATVLAVPTLSGCVSFQAVAPKGSVAESFADAYVA